jgi:hypothetical protein
VIATAFSFFEARVATLGRAATRALLEFLTVLPEEYRTATLSSERKKSVFAELYEGRERVRER